MSTGTHGPGGGVFLGSPDKLFNTQVSGMFILSVDNSCGLVGQLKINFGRSIEDKIVARSEGEVEERCEDRSCKISEKRHRSPYTHTHGYNEACHTHTSSRSRPPSPHIHSNTSCKISEKRHRALLSSIPLDLHCTS